MIVTAVKSTRAWNSETSRSIASEAGLTWSS